MSLQTLRRVIVTAALLSLLPLVAGAEATDPPLPDSRWRRWQTGALRADRLQHASYSMSASLAIGLVSEDAVVGFAGSAVLGVSKELIDMRDTHFDWGDLTADLLGAGLGAVAAAALVP